MDTRTDTPDMQPQNLTSPATVRHILNRLEIRPSKVLGQNFLVDRNTLEILLRSADLTTADKVIEIGPGLGAVTQALLARCAAVTAIEKDRHLAAYLSRSFATREGLTLHEADALDMDLAALVKKGFSVVVANLPYVAGSRILMEFAQMPEPPQRIVVTVQREVADRITASPGTRQYGLLSLWSQMVYRTELIHTIPPTCFWPRPSVRSAIVKMVKRDDLPDLRREDADMLRAVSRYAFMHRRKQLAKLLGQAIVTPSRSTKDWQDILQSCNLAAHVRPESLSPADWLQLTATALSGCRLSH